MKNLLVRFVRNESGATAIEYSLIAGLIAVGIIAATSAVGTDISGLFGRISAKLKLAV
ncbi:Flp family type IVb pilin [Ensifer aridi]|uniref:Flp family type IVb pilin n=1 Tax=Ensifer aridi TaxID=1708715 RepID=UPI00040ABE76|nr:Flp family type IVb pilin [Ensifer aridi]